MTKTVVERKTEAEVKTEESTENKDESAVTITEQVTNDFRRHFFTIVK